MQRSIKSTIVNLLLNFFSIVGAISLVYLAAGVINRSSISRHMLDRKDFTQETEPATIIDQTTNSAVNNKIVELLRASPQCLLPCWWGFTPGTSTLPEMNGFLASYAFNGFAQPATEGKSSLAMFQLGGQELGFPRVNMAFQDDLLTNIVIEELGQEYVHSYSLPGILKTYGPPHQICVLPFDEKYTLIPYGTGGFVTQTNSDYSRLILLLSYPEKGIDITYKFKSNETCCALRADLGETESLRLALYEPQTFEVHFAEFACADKQYDPGQFVSGPPLSGGFHPLIEVSELSIDMFYRRFLKMQDGQDWLQVSTRTWRAGAP